MGAPKPLSKYSGNCENKVIYRNNINPDPSKFKISKVKEKNGHIAVFVNYPNCNNFEGNKILVFDNTSIDEIMSKNYLDPHFACEDINNRLVARFVPTNFGWKKAIEFLDII